MGEQVPHAAVLYFSPSPEMRGSFRASAILLPIFQSSKSGRSLILGCMVINFQHGVSISKPEQGEKKSQADDES
jgi:hypothetical protein